MPETPGADQGDLWIDAAPPESPPSAAAEPQTIVELPAEPERQLDSFIADLPPPDESDEQVVATAPVRAPGARRRATSPTSLAVRAEPSVEEDYGYDDDVYYENDSGYSMLRNPYVLAGLAVAIAIVAAVFVVVLFGSGGGGGFNGGVADRPITPEPGDDGGIKGRAVAISAVREGPGREYFEIGLIRTGNEVSVVGRNADSSWYEIIYPNSNLQGWVAASALKLPDNAASLIQVVSFTPIPKPSVVQPTATPSLATPTGVAGPAPDLELATLGGQCQTGEPITLALRNVGSVPVTGRQVSVIVTTASGVTSQSTMTVTLAPGQAVPVSTGQVAQPPRTTVSVVFTSAPQDSNPSNNVVVCTVGSGGGGGPSGGSTAVPPPIGSTPNNN